MTTESVSLVKGLLDPAAYDYPVTAVELLETHISWVLLTGDYAYKIKKPVDFGFIDYSTLEKRRTYCEEEIRLNRRFSSDIYLDCVAIRGAPEYPRFSDEGPVLEYAVKMRQFSQQDLFSDIADRGELSVSHAEAIGNTIANIHDKLPVAKADDPWGSPEMVSRWTTENLQQLQQAFLSCGLPGQIQPVRETSLDLGNALTGQFEQRKLAGKVRECHGDLHLANIALLGGQVTPFDCIEFEPELRWIDTMSEVAFVAMDLREREYTACAWHFLNRYLQASGDYDGLPLLRYYEVYRALVRAKVTALSCHPGEHTDQPQRELALRYFQLGENLLKTRNPGLVIMHGLSGSGKSTVARELVGRLGALQIRSDLERKRMFNLDPTANSESPVDGGIYTRDAAERVYQRLADLATVIIQAGYCVIVDATFLQRWQRQLLFEAANRLDVPSVIVSLQVEASLLSQRLQQRATAGNDPSEAGPEVLARQLSSQDLLDESETAQLPAVMVGKNGLSDEDLVSIRRHLK